MSRIGKLVISLPRDVKISFTAGVVEVCGPIGSLSRKLPRELDLEIKDNQVQVVTGAKTKKVKALHGTYRALINNMVTGVSEGWKKELELVGTGYRAQLSGKDLILNVGYSHPVEVKSPEGISFKVEKTSILVQGIDKELVGEVAAKIRRVRPPEPYKGKGIRYKDEVIRRKPGKAAKAAGGV